MTSTPATEQLDGLAAAATLLSRWLLHAPDDVALTRVRDPQMLRQWPLAPGEGIEQLHRSRLAGEDAAAVRTDHRLLFVGPGALRAAPYESVHRSREGLLFDEQTLQVRAAYTRWGLAVPRLGRDPDDHIGLELEFVAHLCSVALLGEPAADAALAELGVFVEEHLRQWVPQFAGQVTSQAQTHLYRGVGLLLGDLLTALTTFSTPVGETRCR